MSVWHTEKMRIWKYRLVVRSPTKLSLLHLACTRFSATQSLHCACVGRSLFVSASYVSAIRVANFIQDQTTQKKSHTHKQYVNLLSMNTGCSKIVRMAMVTLSRISRNWRTSSNSVFQDFLFPSATPGPEIENEQYVGSDVLTVLYSWM
jgi:hypothetical protein